MVRRQPPSIPAPIILPSPNIGAMRGKARPVRALLSAIGRAGSLPKVVRDRNLRRDPSMRIGESVVVADRARRNGMLSRMMRDRPFPPPISRNPAIFAPSGLVQSA